MSTTPSVSSAQPQPVTGPPQVTAEAGAAGKAAPPVLEPAARVERAQSIVHRNVLWALGVGLVPMPIVDFVGVAGVQLKMLRELAKLYDVGFSEQVSKKILASLVAGLGSAAIGGTLGSSLIKFLPIVGPTLGAVSMPIVGGAFTLATGRIFVAHLESGGTILNFDAKAIREHFRAEFEQAKQAVSQMKKDDSAKPQSAAASTTVA